jgi:hypothetical protein
MARIFFRLPQRLHVPWQAVLLAVVVLMAAGAVAFSVSVVRSRVTSENTPALAVPAVQQPVAQPVQPAPVVAPVKEWPKAQVQWQRVAQPAGVTAFTKIDDGFYTGTDQNAQAGASPTAEGTAFARKILPQLEKATAIVVAAARAPTDKNVILVAILAGDKKIVGPGYLLISVDGGTSWHHLNLPAEVSPHSGTSAVRITQESDNVYPVVRGSNVAEEWYGTTIKRSGLSAP